MSDKDEGRDHEPTQKKLDEARARGDIPRSADLTAAAAMAGVLLVALGFGPAAMTGFGQGAQSFLWQSGRIARQGGRPVVAVVRDALAEYVARHRGGGR